MTSRENVIETIRFGKPERIPFNLPEKYGSDFEFIRMSPSPEDRPIGKGDGVDEWGSVWKNIGNCNLYFVVTWHQ